MFPHIICFCGRSLGDIYDIYKFMRAERHAIAYKATAPLDPAILPIVESVQVKMGDVMDMLHIHVDCCRQRLLTAVEFNDIY